ncbi:MAG: aminopeptidase [Candidatus Omnitrophota bacterium]|nr:aminopeptidase [Candidatus Omnitrophota bacterium]
MMQKNALKAVFEKSLKLTSMESCLIVTDTLKLSIAQAFYEYAQMITDKVKLVVIDPAREHGAEPSQNVAEIMLRYNVQLLITQKSLTHTLARRQATLKGARIATMPSITEDIANRCLDIDYEDLKKESNRICTILKKTRKVKVTTSLGTDIVFEIGIKTFFGANGGTFDFPGAFGNLPEGEVAFAPTKADGVFIVDASFPEIGILDSPITFKVKNGSVYEISGKDASVVKKRLDAVGHKAYRVAELGIGLNPKAKITGCILEDEKVAGTVHIALGNNLFGGGTNDVPLHLDGVITKPTVYLDEEKIIEDGNFCLNIIEV